MRKIIFILLLLLATTLSAQLPSFPNQPVLDQANLLSPSQEKQLNERVASFEDETSMQIRLVTVKDVSPYETASQYAEDLYHTWKLGDKDKHNGLLLVIAEKIGKKSSDKKDYCRIMTGWGIVRIVSDSMVVEDIKHKYMMAALPHQPYLAFDNSLDRLFDQIRLWKTNYPDDTTVQQAIQDSSQEDSHVWFWFIMAVCIIIGVIMWYLFIKSLNSDSRMYSKSNDDTTRDIATGVMLGSMYSTSQDESSSKKSNTTSGCGSSGCSSSSGCGSSGCGGGGCGGGGCGS